MSRIRVLVVDDAVIVRKLVTDVINADPALEVVGIAANGKIALQRIELLRPDLVTLDIEMPEMDGLETVVEIRKRWPTLPVIMFSTLTAHGAAATMDALDRGASDYVTKPSNVGSMAAAQLQVRDQLVPKIKALAGRRTLFAPPPAIPILRPPAPPVPSALPASRAAVQIVVVGASTGGPNALAALIPALPANFPVPIVIVQHMPPIFTKLLADRLMAASKLRVLEATDGAVAEPGTVWIAPGDYHVEFARAGGVTRLVLTQAAPEHSCRPAVDVLFRSAAAHFGAHVLGAVLTGMGQDGTIGAELIRRSGGQILVQDEASSVVWGMPGSIARAGLANVVLPLSAMADTLTQAATAAPAPRARERLVGASPVSITTS